MAQAVRQIRNAVQREAKLHCGRHLVDVLAARSRAAYELKLQVLLGDGADVFHGREPAQAFRSGISWLSNFMIWSLSASLRFFRRLSCSSSM